MKKKPILRYLIIIDRDFIWKQEKPYHCHAHFCVNSLLSDAIKKRFEGTHYINHELKVKDRKTGRLLFEGNNYSDFLMFATIYESQNMDETKESEQKMSPLRAAQCLLDGICFKCDSNICVIKNNGFCRFFQFYKTIETALKEKEQQDSVLKILKEVITFAKKLPDFEIDDDGNIKGIFGAVGMKIQRQMENKERELLRKWVLETCFPKELKALEIIKEKKVDIQTLERTNNVTEYNSYVVKGIGEKELTQEEYELLKEILK